MVQTMGVVSRLDILYKHTTRKKKKGLRLRAHSHIDKFRKKRREMRDVR